MLPKRYLCTNLIAEIFQYAIEIIGEPGWDRTNDHLIKSQMTGIVAQGPLSRRRAGDKQIISQFQ